MYHSLPEMVLSPVGGLSESCLETVNLNSESNRGSQTPVCGFSARFYLRPTTLKKTRTSLQKEHSHVAWACSTWPTICPEIILAAVWALVSQGLRSWLLRDTCRQTTAVTEARSPRLYNKMLHLATESGSNKLKLNTAYCRAYTSMKSCK